MRKQIFLVLAAAAMLAACEENATEPAGSEPIDAAVQAASSHAAHANGGELSPAALQGIARLRQATAKLHDIEVARAAGYTDQWPAGCAASPEGAQAYHYLDPSLLDGEADLLRPELLMYEPQPDGSLQLVGVDYFIPVDEWQGTEPPTLLGQSFGYNAALSAWTLHIWAWRPNPSGMFAAWNPNVSCQYAW